MCITNSGHKICTTTFPTLLATSTHSKPAVPFCARTKGILIIELLHLLSSHPYPNTLTASDLTAELIDDPANFWSTLTACNLNHGNKSSNPKAWNRIVHKCFRDTARYIQRQMVTHGVLASTSDGLCAMREFESVDEATAWFSSLQRKDTEGDFMMSGAIVTPAPKPKPLASSYWATAGAQEGSLVDSMRSLDLNNGQTPAIETRVNTPVVTRRPPPIRTHDPISAWSARVPSVAPQVVSSPVRMERLARERSELVARLVAADKEEMKTWVNRGTL